MARSTSRWIPAESDRSFKLPVEGRFCAREEEVDIRLSKLPAHAQDTDLSHGWDVRAGFFVPEQQAARTAEGDLWFTIGVERAVYEAERWKGTISVDYYGSGSLYNIPICVNLRGNTARLRYGA